MGKCILAGHPPVGGQIGYGTYTGNGAANRTISLGITPKWVLVLDEGYRTYESGGNNHIATGGLAIEGKGVSVKVSVIFTAPAIEIVDGGFTVHQFSTEAGITFVSCNASGASYNYIYGT